MNTILKLPYSFVPCATSIYVPHWAHQVSHDIPFRESYSGAIDVTLTNHGYLLKECCEMMQKLSVLESFSSLPINFTLLEM